MNAMKAISMIIMMLLSAAGVSAAPGITDAWILDDRAFGDISVYTDPGAEVTVCAMVCNYPSLDTVMHVRADISNFTGIKDDYLELELDEPHDEDCGTYRGTFIAAMNTSRFLTLPVYATDVSGNYNVDLSCRLMVSPIAPRESGVGQSTPMISAVLFIMAAFYARKRRHMD